MVDEKELKRVMEIARSHARTALSKPEIQRESFLAYCRNSWKRYAAGVTKNAGECERFAVALDRATRDMIALAEASPEELAERRSIWEDSVEGAMDSVLMHEAHQAPELPVQAEEEAVAAPTLVEASPVEQSEIPAVAADIEAQRRAEEEDRLVASYTFGGVAPREGLPKAQPPEHAPELQRKVRDVLRAHLQNKGDDET